MAIAQNEVPVGVSGLVLEPHHLEDLRRSGLNDETIRQSGIYTESSQHKLAAMLNRQYAKCRGTSMVIPFRDATGEISGYKRAKPTVPRVDRNGRAIKYESPSGVDNHAYFPPGVADRLNDHGCELVITEGEKKSLKATQEGFPAIGLTGVFGWKRGKGTDKLIRDLECVVWKARAVVIVYDSDLKDNDNVKNGESRLVQQLTSRGAHVKVARLPDGPGGEKVGLDDFLIAHGGPALRALLDRAEDPEPLSLDDYDKPDLAEMDPVVAARDYIEHCHTRDGRLTLHAWRGELYRWNGSCYRPVPVDEVRADILHFYAEFSCRSTTRTLANIIECVRAESIITASSEPPRWLSPNDWDASRCLATESGILPVDSLNDHPVLISPTPDFFTVNGLDFAFDPVARCPEWERFLTELWPDDPQSIQTLQEIFGYLLLPDTSQQKMFMMLGPRRSGKGTIARILKAVVGPGNCCAPKLGSLAGNFGVQPLLNKTVAIIGDARLSGRTDSDSIVESLLSITGEDHQTVERKHMVAVHGKLPVRFMLLSNELPRLADASATLPSRMILLRLTESFYGREDHGLTDRLIGELPGVLNWALSGWQRLNRRGHFVQPERSKELLDDLECLSSPMTSFLRDQCVFVPHTQTAVKDLYASWKAWCEVKGRRPGSEQVFGRDLRAAAPQLDVRQRRDPMTGKLFRVYAGLGIASDSRLNRGNP